MMALTALLGITREVNPLTSAPGRVVGYSDDYVPQLSIDAHGASIATVLTGWDRPSLSAAPDAPSRSEAARRFAAEGAAGAGDLSEAFHYTGSQNIKSRLQNGLRPNSFATTSGDLSPLQAQLDLACLRIGACPVGSCELT
jgi:hypothetical protein